MSLNDILEWQAIVALRAYLIFALPGPGDGDGFTTGDNDPLDEAVILRENARAGFEFELTKVFPRPDIISSTPNSAAQNRCRPILVELLKLLNCLAWTAPKKGHGPQFQHIFDNTDTPYDRYWYLVEYLETVGLPFNLISGPFGPAFGFPADDELLSSLKIVEDVNTALDSLPLSATKEAGGISHESLVDAVSLSKPDDAMRQYASTAFTTVFSRLGGCTTTHNAMLYLRSQYDNVSSSNKKPLLDLFISSCPKHDVCREILCSCPVGDEQYTDRSVPDLCKLIHEKKQQCIRLHAEGQELQNITQGVSRARHGRDAPSSSLQALILRDVFKPLDLRNVVSDRFSRTEKRSLVRDIVNSFSSLLGSEWVGRGWCSKSLFFLKKKLDQDRSNTPFGPYVTCSIEGPPLADLERWEAHLDDPPILLFLAKLLLEIDLGTDLEGKIETALKEDEEETLFFLLSDIYEEYKCDLDYGEAIDACLRYHVERQLRLDDGEIIGEPGQCSEWDRRYVRGVVRKLKDPAAEVALQCGKQAQPPGWWGVNWSYPASETLSQTTGSGAEVRLSSVAEAVLSPSQSRVASTAPTSFNLDKPRPEAPNTQQKPPPIGSLKPNLAPTFMQPPPELPLSISGWLDGADESVADPTNPLDSRPSYRLDADEVDAGVLFDTTEDSTLHEHQKEKAKMAEEFWILMRDFNKRHFPVSIEKTPDHDAARQSASLGRVKIALIDTGVDIEDPLIFPEYEKGRIRGCSWVGEETDFRDTCGHGTHLVRLVLRTNKTAEILVAKVAEGKAFTPKNRQNVVEAIEWAVEQDADIISLSLGFKSRDKSIENALKEAINPKKGNTGSRPRLVFAAAANWGFNRGLAFPASMKGVICVHATSGNGYDGQINPSSAVDHQLNFPVGTLGITIESAWQGERVWLKGTSYSTPIAAAVAANVLEFDRQQRRGKGVILRSSLESYRGMKAAMSLMCTDNNDGGYSYFAPWVVYEKQVDAYSPEKIRTTEQIRGAIEERLDSLHYG